ncbi:MAG: LamG domain-containing protein [Syntrophaceae bacterium]|nr:LamG domain-containing protein [Syntrophaceae bacterium]
MENIGKIFKIIIGGGIFIIVFVLAYPVLAQTCFEPPEGLVNWWDADSVSGSTAFDIAGENDVTMEGGISIVSGLVGNGFNFDGVDDFINIGQPLSLSEGTVELWVNRQGFTSWSDVFIGSVNLTSLPNRAPTFGVQSPGALIWEFGNLTVRNTGKLLAIGEWHHLSMTWKQNPNNTHSVVVYLDGVIVGTGISTGVTGFTDVLIGAYNWPNPLDQFARAIIDEISIYNRNLSDTEIQTIFLAGSEGKCKVIDVSIDIKPGSFSNSINPRSQGVIPLAILTTDNFDASAVDVTTVLFGSTGTEATPMQSALEDVDEDGDTDMILHFNTQDTDIQCGDTVAVITGNTFDGRSIKGADIISTVVCK